MSTSWQTVSVFISSTFNDMHAERDYLVKRVFPELREWCEKRKLRLVDIDLRWGVTEEDATNHKNVVKVCLDRIDECRPFFLCFLGQRRGWVPGKADVSKETCDTYKDLKVHLGTSSVTELEILHATINPLNDKNRAQYSFFYLRDDSYLKDIPANPPLLRKTYTNEGIRDQNERAIADKQLTTWRNEKIPETRRPVHHYSAIWNENAKTPELSIPPQCPSSNPLNQDQWRKLWEAEAGIDVPDLDIEKNPELAEKARIFNENLSRGRLGDFTSESKPLSAIILDDLKKAITERYPDHQEISEESDLQKELDQQEQFLNLNSEGFIERTGDFDHLDMYVDGDSRNLFVLTAPGGMGKTMLLANWINHYQSKREAKDTVLFFRFIGASDRSTTVDSVMRYLLREMKENAGLFDDEIPADPEKLRNAWPELLAKVGCRKKTIIIIDAVNQLESGLSDLRWIPWQMVPGIKVIISFKRDSDDTEKLCKQFAESKVVTLAEVKPFTNAEDQKALINAYLLQYLKELDDTRITELISIPGAMNPLFLKIILSELRVFGAFTNLGEKIRNDFGETPVSTFGAVLKRLESDPSYSPIDPKVVVPLLFGLLSHARHGLSEEELVSIFLQELRWEDTLENRENFQDAIRLILRQVRPFLALRDGRHDFFYESLRSAAIDRYEGSSKEQSQQLSTEWHGLLAKYFEQLPVWVSLKENIPTFRRAAELPYHLAWAGKADRLADLILKYKLIEAVIFGPGRFVAIEDISFVVSPPVLPENKIAENWINALIIIQDALKLSLYIPIKEPSHLAIQILGRLVGYDDAIIKIFLQNVIESQIKPWLRPITCSFQVPGGPLIYDFLGHTLPIQLVTVTPDGRKAISVSWSDVHPGDCALKVWDLDNGKVLFSLMGHTNRIKAAVVTPDGKRVVSGSADNTLKVWNLESGILLHTLKGHSDDVEAVAITPNGKIAVSGSRDTTLKVWDLESGRELHALVGHTDWIETVSVTPDGCQIISGSRDSTLKVWELESGRLLHTLNGHKKWVTAVAVTPDGRRIVSGSWDKTLKVWDLESGRELHTLNGGYVITQRKSTNPMVLTPDGKQVISGYFHEWEPMVGRLCIWDLESGKMLFIFEGEHSNYVNAISVTPDGTQAISASDDGTLKIWDLKRGKELHTLKGHTHSVNSVTILPDGTRAISASADWTLKVWDLKSNKEFFTFKGHFLAVNAVCVSQDGTRVVSGSDDKTLKVLNLENGRELFTLTGHSKKVTAVAITLDGRKVVSGSEDETLEVWDLKSGRKSLTVIGHSGTINEVTVTPDGRRAVSGSYDKTLKVWDLENGRELFTLTGHTDWVRAVVLTTDGLRAVSGSDDKTLKVWDLENGRELFTLTGHSDKITAIAVTLDGQKAVSVSSDKTLKVWDLENGRESFTFKGHAGIVSAMALTPDGRLVISSSRDSASKHIIIKVWEIENGRILHTISGNSGEVDAIAVTPDGKKVIFISDNDLKVWDFQSEKIIMEFSGEISINSCGISTFLNAIIVGDRLGRIIILRMENCELGSPILTAWHSYIDNTYAYGCLYCRSWTEIPKSSLAQEVVCPVCGNKLELNPSTIEGNWWRLALEWQITKDANGYKLSRSIEQPPIGPDFSFTPLFLKNFPDIQKYLDDIKPVLECISVQKEAVPFPLLASAIGVDEHELNLRLTLLGQLIIYQERNDINGREKILSPFHSCFVEWLKRKSTQSDKSLIDPYEINVENGMKALTGACWRDYKEHSLSMYEYSLIYLPIMLLETHRYFDYAEIMTDYRFLQLKIDRAGCKQIMKDYQQILSISEPVFDDHYSSLKENLKSILNAITESSDIIQQDPEQIRSQLWGRLAQTNLPEVRNLLNSAIKSTSAPWLRPITASLNKQSGSSFNKSLLVKEIEWNRKKIKSLTVTANGNYLIAGSIDGYIGVWDLETGDERYTIKSPGGLIMSIASTNDGKWGICGYDKIVIWEILSGKIIRIIDDTQGNSIIGLQCIGYYLISGFSNDSITIQDLKEENPPNILRVLPDFSDSILFGNAIGNDGKTIAFGSQNGLELYVLSIDTTKPVDKYKHSSVITAVALTSDCEKAITSTYEGMITVWNLKEKIRQEVLFTNDQSISAISYASNPDRIITGNKDGIIKIWDAISMRNLWTRVKNVEYAERKMERILTSDGNIGFFNSKWDIADGFHSGVLPVQGCLTLLEDFNFIASSTDNKVTIWNMTDVSFIRKFEGHNDLIESIAMIDSLGYIVSGSRDKTLRIWDLKSGKCHAILNGHKDWITCITVSKKCGFFISGSLDGYIKIWDSHQYKEIATLKGHFRPLTTLLISDFDKSIISAAEDNIIKIWDLENQRESQIINGYIGTKQGLAITSDGRYLVFGNLNDTVRIWDILNKTERISLEGLTSHPLSVAISPDGKLVAAAEEKGRILIWDFNSGVCMGILEGHSKPITQLEFTPCSRYLISGSQDSTIKMWDLSNFVHICTFSGKAEITQLVVSTQKPFVLCMDAKGSIHSLKIETNL